MDFAVSLDHQSQLPLHRQLYEEFRKSIMIGRLTAGDRIPSTRSLAASLGVSRATVTQCYDQLISEGYLQTVIGSGTTVSSQLPDEFFQPPAIKPFRPAATRSRADIRLSKYGARLKEIIREPSDSNRLIAFNYCRPAVDQFPLEQWRRLLLRQCRTQDAGWLDYPDDGRGYPPLREAIASYLTRSRAARCDADQILIVNGSQQALQLIAQILVERGDAVALEEPGYLGARQVFQMHGAQFIPAPVDESGILVDRLPSHSAKLIYVSPSHQFPTGAILSLRRRLDLLAWAENSNALVIEDDYDSEFRYNGRPIPALQGLDRNESVLYIGTFSKVMFPALRIGYLVAPRPLAAVLERAKWLTDRHTAMLEQRALTDFIREGHMERHLRRMRRLYDQRRQTLVRALQTHFGDRVMILGENSGMHLMIELETQTSNTEIVLRAAEVGVGLNDARQYYLGSGGDHQFVLGYAGLSERKIQEGVRRLAKVLK
jgi:GntR family transcriptional regulator/MocR family aminotransferase